MAKRIFFVMIILTGLISFASQNAFAIDNILTAYIAKYDGGNYSEKINQTFNWGQKPFLYVAGRFNKISETWTNPLGTLYQFTVLDNGAKDLWSDDGIIVNHLPFWNDRKEPGIWDWSVQAWNSGEGVGNTISGSFNVAPEPISTALFLLGGGVLAIRQYRKKKLNA